MSTPPLTPFGRYLREQRQLAQLSLREMARLSKVSNAYLSQIERGLHAPSVRVLSALASTLGVPVEDLVSMNTPGSPRSAPAADTAVEEAIRHESRLSQSQKEALLAVFRSYLSQSDED